LLKNCAECGNVFAEEGDLCLSCLALMQGDFQKIREFSFANPNASLQQIAAGTGASEPRIILYLRQGKLRVVSQGKVVCARCGTEVLRGPYCRSCELDIKEGRPLNKKTLPPRRN